MKTYRLLSRLVFFLVIQSASLSSAHADELWDSAIAAHKQGDYSKAIWLLTDYIAKNPNHVDAHSMRGKAWGMRRQYDLAISDFSHAIRLKPNAAGLYLNRGFAWQTKREYDKAIEDYNQANLLDPKNPLVIHNRGNCWMYKKEYDKALKDFDEAVQLNPKSAMHISNRGLAWDAKKEYEKAIKDHSEALRIDPKAAFCFDALATIHATCNDAKYRQGKRAIELAQKACELSNWENPFYIDTLAAAYAESGDFAKAIEFQQKALADRLIEKSERPSMEKRLSLYQKKQPYRKTD